MVIALDLRGHGASDKPRDPAEYGTPFVADLVRLLDHLGIERAHIVGYSMGAVITLKLLTVHPDRVASAVLGGAGWRPAAMGPPERVDQWQRQLEMVARGETTIAEVVAGPDTLLLPPPMRAALNRNDPAVLAAVLQGNRGLLTVTDGSASRSVLAIAGNPPCAR
jgi:pimeloyl-ACP methyl ester carboxylesterase